MAKRYTPPRKDKIFKKFWKLYISKVSERENFHEGHLQQLKILVDMLTEYEKLTLYIIEKGYTYHTDGRYGEKHIPYPEVQFRSNIIKEIRAYAKQLDLVLTKDKTTNDGNDEKWD